MLKLKSLRVAVTLSIAMPLWIADTATARTPEHLTYDQAWARCKAFVDKLGASDHNHRYARGAGCMLKYGYKL